MITVDKKSLCENCFARTDREPCPECGFDGSAQMGDPMMLKPGSILAGRYAIGRVIGKGGFGVTYLAYDLKLECKVAVKEYYPYGLAARVPGSTQVSVSDAGETFQLGAEKFYDEARLVAQFNGNANIVSVHDFFYENNTVYFTMGYLEGQTLKDCLKEQGALTPGEAVFVAEAVANALTAAHSRNVLHRDISPDNIMICRDGTVKLLDFGAARQVLTEGSQSLSVILKQGYAPLEQYQKKGKQGPWTDIYSLGATLYYALTLDTLDDPMSRLEDDSEYEANRHGIEEGLWRIIRKATELRGADRYQEVSELRRELDRLPIEPIPLGEALGTGKAGTVAHSRLAEEPGVTMPLHEEEPGATMLLREEEPDKTVPFQGETPTEEAASSPVVSEERGAAAGVRAWLKRNRELGIAVLFGVFQIFPLLMLIVHRGIDINDWTSINVYDYQSKFLSLIILSQGCAAAAGGAAYILLSLCHAADMRRGYHKGGIWLALWLGVLFAAVVTAIITPSRIRSGAAIARDVISNGIPFVIMSEMLLLGRTFVDWKKGVKSVRCSKMHFVYRYLSAVIFYNYLMLHLSFLITEDSMSRYVFLREGILNHWVFIALTEFVTLGSVMMLSVRRSRTCAVLSCLGGTVIPVVFYCNVEEIFVIKENTIAERLSCLNCSLDPSERVMLLIHIALSVVAVFLTFFSHWHNRKNSISANTSAGS